MEQKRPKNGPGMEEKLTKNQIWKKSNTKLIKRREFVIDRK